MFELRGGRYPTKARERAKNVAGTNGRRWGSIEVILGSKRIPEEVEVTTLERGDS